MIPVFLTQNKIAFIDDVDKDAVSLYTWHAERSKSGIWYATTSITKNGQRTTLRMHQVILPVPDGYEVDHVDGNGLNNVRSNLRIASRAQQAHNTRGKIERYKGITFQKRLRKRPWQARIMSDGKVFHLGYFATKEEAATAYDNAAREKFGKFAKINGHESEISDNKLRKVINAITYIYPSPGRNGRRQGHIDVQLDCGHSVKKNISRYVGTFMHCQKC